LKSKTLSTGHFTYRFHKNSHEPPLDIEDIPMPYIKRIRQHTFFGFSKESR
jgi:hypothetical protein